jgi:hypothetical protein
MFKDFWPQTGARLRAVNEKDGVILTASGTGEAVKYANNPGKTTREKLYKG